MAKSKWLAAGGAGVALLVATIAGHEGLRTKAYRDIVGIPTICYGETLGVKMGQVKTVAECNEMLKVRLHDYVVPIESCLPNLPTKRKIAFVSLGYNIGAQTACQSTAAKLIRLGKVKEGCDAFLRFSKAKTKTGFRTVKGLLTRREEERKLCLQSD